MWSRSARNRDVSRSAPCLPERLRAAFTAVSRSFISSSSAPGRSVSERMPAPASEEISPSSSSSTASTTSPPSWMQSGAMFSSRCGIRSQIGAKVDSSAESAASRTGGLVDWLLLERSAVWAAPISTRTSRCSVVGGSHFGILKAGVTSAPAMRDPRPEREVDGRRVGRHVFLEAHVPAPTVAPAAGDPEDDVAQGPVEFPVVEALQGRRW